MTFNFEEKEVRTELINGVPFFCLKDVCGILGLDQSHRVASRLEEDDRTTITVIDNLGREQNVTFINESGLYNTIFQSRKEEAKKFKKWITSKVLPEIRKTGGYNLQNKLPTTFAEALKLAYEQQLKIEEQTKQLEQQKPAIDFYKAVTDSKTALPIREVAKLLSDQHNFIIGQNRLFEYLRNNKVLMDNNTPFQKYIDKGYFRIIEQKFQTKGETRIYIKTLVFQKGIDFILKKLKTSLQSVDL